MLLRNLRYLDALAREEHFARAAALCKVTQPTLSAGIKQLEEELGLLMVQRGQRFQGLTPGGQRVLEWARRVLADTESLEQVASELRAGLVGRLRIGVIPTALPAVAMLTTPFAERHPQVNITALSQSSIDIQRGLDDFSLDAGVTYLDNEPLTGVRTLPLYQERYFLFTAGPGTTDRSSLRWDQVGEFELCLLTPEMQNRRILDAHFRAAGVTVRAAIETNSVLTLWAHVRSGRWASILPQPFLHLLGEPEGIRAVPFESDTPGHTIGLVVPDREPLTPSARELFTLAGEVNLTTALDSGRPRATTGRRR